MAKANPNIETFEESAEKCAKLYRGALTRFAQRIEGMSPEEIPAVAIAPGVRLLTDGLIGLEKARRKFDVESDALAKDRDSNASPIPLKFPSAS